MAFWVRSPCIAVCKLDKTGTFCTGCFRLSTEIGAWSNLSKEEKQSVVRLAAARKEQNEQKNS